MMMLLSKHAKQIFCLDTTTGKFQVSNNMKRNCPLDKVMAGKNGTIIETFFKVKDTLQEMVDYSISTINENYFLRITKFHTITIFSGRFLTGLCNYEILEK